MVMESDGERSYREALQGGGWCLEWLHPPPKGFNVKGEREKKRDDKRERERERERD